MKLFRNLCSALALAVFAAFPAQAQDAPVANGGSFSTKEDTPLLGALSATAAEGRTVSFRIGTPPAHGSISAITNAGGFVYLPSRDYNGDDSFTFIANDGSLDSTPATVSLTINPVNDAPVTTGTAVSGDEDTPLHGTLTATDVDGDSPSFRVVTPPVHGTAVVVASGAFTFEPSKDFNGYDSFKYVASDGVVDSTETTVLLTIKPVNDAPTAQEAAFAVPPGRTLIEQLPGFDRDGDTITYEVSAQPARGKVAIDSDGRFSYTPNPGFKGVDTFAFKVRDATLTSLPGSVTIKVANDAAGFIGDLAQPKITSVDFPFLPSTNLGSLTSPAVDIAVDRANRRLYALTGTALEIYDLDPGTAPPTLNRRESVSVTGKLLTLSLDGRTAFIGGTGKVTAINLYPEGAFEGGKTIQKAAYTHIRVFPFSPAREIAAMGVHPAGNRLVVVIDALVKKLDIRNDLLISDVGRGQRVENLTLPADFGYLTQLNISADVQTDGAARPEIKFSPAVDLKALIYSDKAVALGIKSLAFSPDGNCAFISAVGAGTTRATAFGMMPTSDEGTGGIVVLDVRPKANNDLTMGYLGFIPTVEKGENTAELRRQIVKEGLRTVHPEVQAAKMRLGAAEGMMGFGMATGVGAGASVSNFGQAVDEYWMLQSSFKDWGFMWQYRMLYPRDMVGASSIAINHIGDFGVVTLQDTNNIGLLSLTPSGDLFGYRDGVRPDFYIATGTGKTVNGFDPALGTQAATTTYSWAYPQKVAFTSDDSRIYIGMAGGVPKNDLSNRFGSADAFMLRTERDNLNSRFKGGNPPPGYSLVSGVSQKRPWLAATLQSFDSDHDLFSNQLEAYNRWNVMKEISAQWKDKLVSTDPARMTNPGEAASVDSTIPDYLDRGYFLPPSGLGYRLNTYGMASDTTNFATRSVVTAIERIGVEWNKHYHEQMTGTHGSITRPYFIVGLLSQPGGGVIKNQTQEALKYRSGNGSEVDFLYFSKNSDSPHDFVQSNGPNSPTDNSMESVENFDVENTKALIGLLLAEPHVKAIEVDPCVLDLIPEIRNDPRIIPHGNRNIPGCRRDMDNHMFVTFSHVSVDLDIDSDNDGVLDQSSGEDALEAETGSAGKYVPVNHGDQDTDGIPDYADGYDRDPGQSAPNASARFTPIAIRIPDGLDVNGMEFRLIYSASDPAAVTYTDGKYTLPHTGGFRIWTRDGNEPRKMAPIDATPTPGDFIKSGVSYAVSLLPLGANRRAIVYIESVSPGLTALASDVIIELITNAGAQSSVVQLTDAVRVMSGIPAPAVDANRDGQIRLASEDNSDTTTAQSPYVVFINDIDSDADGIADASDNVVNGAANLRSFVPVFLDFKQILTAFPPATGTTYTLIHPDDALNFVYTNLTRAAAFSYLGGTSTTGYGPSFIQPASSATTQQITATGVRLSDGFLTQIKDQGKGVVLIEERQMTDKPLILRIERSGMLIAEASLFLKTLRHQLAVDADRDGQIKLATEDSSDATSVAKPFRFWINDDDDQSPFEGDNMPGQPENKADFNNTTVDSVRDLVDFFAVYLDIKQLLDLLPHTTAGITYKLKQADGALNFVYTNRTRTQAFDYQTQILITGFGPSFIQAAAEATTEQITAAGATLNTTFLDGVKNNDWGVILVEGRTATTAPLRLVVEKNGTEIAELSLNIKISSAEQMFRHVNLTAQVQEYDAYGSGIYITPPKSGVPTNTAQPLDYPDSLTNGKYFVFIHGFNVDADSARGWNAEIFKRMHAMGSKARFVGVQWNGTPPSIIPGKYLDYHKAVFQAFQTGDLLAGALSFTNGADVTVAAHSLGNIVTSHAIQNGGFMPTRYYMINAAVAIEAYSLSDAWGQFDIMRHEHWVPYETRLYASKWHELFASTPSDNRNALTWKLRFENIILTSELAHNFFSGEEDVVADGDEIDDASIFEIITQGNLPAVATGEYSWKLQELVKGANLLSSAASLVLKRLQGGWGFSTEWNILEDTDPGPGTNWQSHRRPPNDTSSIPTDGLKTEPFFRRFLEPDLMSADATVASNKAGEAKVKYDVLARAIPAMSHAVAANRLDSLRDNNYNMPVEAKKNGWHDATNRWRHSDFCYVALPYVYPMFQEMISRGGLNQ